MVPRTPASTSINVTQFIHGKLATSSLVIASIKNYALTIVQQSMTSQQKKKKYAE